MGPIGLTKTRVACRVCYVLGLERERVCVEGGLNPLREGSLCASHTDSVLVSCLSVSSKLNHGDMHKKFNEKYVGLFGSHELKLISKASHFIIRLFSNSSQFIELNRV